MAADRVQTFVDTAEAGVVLRLLVPGVTQDPGENPYIKEVQSESFLEKTRFYYYGNGRLSYSTLKEGLVFTSITCI